MDKLLLIRSVGYIIPQSALLAAAIVCDNETSYDMPMRELSAMPEVTVKSSKNYYLYLEIKREHVPLSAVADDEAEEEEVLEEVAPKRRGRKAKAVVEAEPEVSPVHTFNIHLHEDVLNEEVMPLNATQAVRAYASTTEGYTEIEKRLRLLATRYMEYNNSVNDVAPQMTVISDLLPPDLARDVNRTTASGIEAHAEQMRREAELSRKKYDKNINWFRENVLVSERTPREGVNMMELPEKADDRVAGGTSLTQNILIALVKGELTSI